MPADPPLELLPPSPATPPIQASPADYLKALIAQDPRLKSEHTRRSYLSDLQAFEDWRAGRFLSRLLVEQYAAALQQAGKSPRTVNRALAAVRWYARRMAALAQEQPAFSDLARRERAELVAQAERAAGVSDVKGSHQPHGRHISPGELAALLAACEADPSPAGGRDAALIAAAWCTGARRDELAGLDLADFSRTAPEEGELLLRGKGDKDRTAYLFGGAYAALVDWLEQRGTTSGPLFCAIAKGGRVHPEQRLSGEAMRLILDKRIAAARLKPFTWHDFRRTFAGNLLDNGQDLATVQRLMGHADPATTSSYDRRGDETRRRAVRTLFVPYRGKA